MIDITYGVLHYNPKHDSNATKAYTNAVASLNEFSSHDLKKEVYLIDQGSEPHITDHMATECGFHSILLRKNIGISRGINLLANVARGKYICLVTSDVTFVPNLDHVLIEDLENNPDIYQICPLSDNSQIDYQMGDVKNKMIRCLASELTIQMWPRTTFERVGFFEERFKAAYENVDYAVRCFIDGGNNAISCRAKIHHELNMCVKSGARNHTYDGYIYMKNGFDQDVLKDIWNKKWPGLNWDALYDPNFVNEDGRKKLQERFLHNKYLPYVQEVGY